MPLETVIVVEQPAVPATVNVAVRGESSPPWLGFCVAGVTVAQTGFALTAVSLRPESAVTVNVAEPPAARLKLLGEAEMSGASP